MNKLILVAVLALAAFAAAAAPAEEFEPLEVSGGVEGSEGSEDHLRFRRVTCDLMSFKGVVGDSACAANCLSMGKAGGTCHGGICQCRKTKIKDLWNKRFGKKN